jgi:L-ribulose-5-phosphate 3-epimerase
VKIQRREFLAAGAAAGVFPLFSATANKIDWSRISVLTDEVAKTSEEAVAFCKQYQLRWVELRDLPDRKGSFMFLDEDRQKAEARLLKDAGLRVSFLNTGMLKFGLPGTMPVRRREETPEQKAKREASEKERFDRRLEDLQRAIRCAHVFGVDKVRVFAFSRVAEPESVFPRVAEILSEMVEAARKEGIRLLIENEGSCNVGTSEELAKLCALVRSSWFGMNWDPVNELGLKASPYPEGYALLPKERIHNVQIKARALVLGPPFLDWKAIFEALARDGYDGKVGLETHVFDGTLIEKAHMCMAKIREIVS